MKQIIKYISVVVLLLCSTEAFALRGGYGVDKGTVAGGDIAFYSDENCKNAISERPKANATVYIKATPDGIHIATGATFVIEKTVSSDVSESRTRSGIGLGEYIDATEVGGGLYSFVMPDDANINVSVSATLADKPTTDGVKYLDAEGKEQTADGVYVLDGTEYELGVKGKTTWYVAQGKLDYNDCLVLYGSVHLILADGAKMTVETDEANAIYAFSAQLFAIYAQSNNENAGALTAISSGGSTGGAAILAVGKNIIINGGYITAKCTSTSSEYENAGIIGNVTINGGHIVATSASPKGSGMFGQSITIGYNNPNTSLIVTGFNGNSEWASGMGRYVIVAEGKVIKYTDDNNEVHELSGTLCTNGDEAMPLNKLIAGKTLRPATAYKLSVDNNLKAYLAEEIKEEYVYKGTKITLKPIANYVLETINNNGTALETTLADGVYTFDMPAADVVIKAVAKKLLTSSDITVSDIDVQTYSGSEIKPAVVVKDGETDITAQFNVAYSNNKNVGTATVTITPKAEALYTGEITRTFTIAQKALTITAEAKTKVYGTEDPALTYTVEGLIEGESLTGALARAEGEAVGEYAITQGTLAASANYSMTFTGAKLTITAATLSGITATAYSDDYDGKAHTIGVTIPEGATIKYGVAEGTYDKDAAPSFTNAGEYTVYYQVTKDNYNTVTGNAKVSIAQKALTITAEAKTKVYGADDPALTYTVEGLIEGESLTGALARAEGEAVGEYAITQGTLAASANYSVTFTGAKLSITAATLSGITATAYSAAYDGKAHTIDVTIPEGATIKYGVAEGTYDKDTAPSYTNVGEYTVYYQITKDNYNVVTGSAKVTIAQKALAITAEAKTKVESEADPELTYTVEGLIVGESLTGALTREEGEAIGEYNITQGTLKASDNYSVTFTGAKFTITANSNKPNGNVVNPEDPVTQDGEEFYKPNDDTQKLLNQSSNVSLGFSGAASQNMNVGPNGEISFNQGQNADIVVNDQKTGDVLKMEFQGTVKTSSSNLELVGNASTRGTRSGQDLELVSGAEYRVLHDGNIVLTVVLTEAPATISGINVSSSGSTGISLVETDQSAEGGYYDLNGRKFDSKPTKKGVYIHQGAKIVVK